MFWSFWLNYIFQIGQYVWNTCLSFCIVYDATGSCAFFIHRLAIDSDQHKWSVPSWVAYLNWITGTVFDPVNTTVVCYLIERPLIPVTGQTTATTTRTSLASLPQECCACNVTDVFYSCNCKIWVALFETETQSLLPVNIQLNGAGCRGRAAAAGERWHV